MLRSVTLKAFVYMLAFRVVYSKQTMFELNIILYYYSYIPDFGDLIHLIPILEKKSF